MTNNNKHRNEYQSLYSYFSYELLHFIDTKKYFFVIFKSEFAYFKQKLYLFVVLTAQQQLTAA